MAGDSTRVYNYLQNQGVITKYGEVNLNDGSTVKLNKSGLSADELRQLAVSKGYMGGERVRGVGKSGEVARETKSKTQQTAEKVGFKPADPKGIYIVPEDIPKDESGNYIKFPENSNILTRNASRDNRLITHKKSKTVVKEPIFKKPQNVLSMRTVADQREAVRKSKSFARTKSTYRAFKSGLFGNDAEASSRAVNPQTPGYQSAAFAAGGVGRVLLYSEGVGRLGKIPSALSKASKAKYAQYFPKSSKTYSAIAETTKKTVKTSAAKKAAKPVVNEVEELSKFAKAQNAFRKSQYAQYLKDFGVGAGSSVAIVKGGKLISGVSAPKEQRSIIFNEKEFKKIVGKGVRARQDQFKGGFKIPASKLGLSKDYSFNPRSLAAELPVVGKLIDKQNVYGQTVSKEFQKLGYEGDRLKTAVQAAQRQDYAGEYALGGSLLNIARYSEGRGRKYVTDKFAKLRDVGYKIPVKKAGFDIFKKTFVPIGKAGAIEGSSSVLAEQVAREQEINFKQIGLGSAFGFGSAGVVGGGIAGLQVNRPALSKFIEYGAYISDPFEKPGDLLQDAVEFGGKRFFKKKYPVPTFTRVFEPSQVINFGGPTVTKTSTKTSTKSKSNVPVSTRINVPGLNVPVFSDTMLFQPGDPIKPTPKIPVNIPPVNINEKVPIAPEIPVLADIPININTNMPVNTNINLKTATPIFRIPPPLPFTLPASGGGGGRGKGKVRKKYLNELDVGFKLLDDLMGFGPAPRKKRRR